MTIKINAQYYLKGTAQNLGNGEIQLTDSAQGEVGAVWSPDKLDLSKDFTVEVELSIGIPPSNGGGGADGLAFVMHNKCRTIGGQSSMGGKGIGYTGITPSVVVEFDTYYNEYVGDPTSSHIGLQKNGNSDHTTNSLVSPVSLASSLKDGLWHTFKISWTVSSKLLEVYFDGNLILSYTGDILNTIFNGNSIVNWGFTSSTGGKYNVHKVKLPEIPDEHSNATICSGESVSYAKICPAFSADSKSSFTWTPSAGVSNIHDQYPVFNPTSSTVYTLAIEDACGAIMYRKCSVDVVAYKTHKTTVSLCKGEQYAWNGVSYAMAGVYVDTLTCKAGCDSIDSLVLTIKHPTQSLSIDTICQGESYVFNGKLYFDAGTYIDTLTNAAGCDSIATLMLTVRTPASVWITSTTSKFECSSENVTTFIAVPVNAGTNPTYQWKLNGNLVGTGDSVYTAANLSVNDNVLCEMTVYEGCSSSVTKTSNIITVKTLESSVTDIENTNYKTVDIGGQTWMAENLKTTTYNDGTPIPNVTDGTAWANLTTGAYCNYDNLESYADIYGRLYNWYAVDTKKLCPSGWHVPSDDEWNILEGNYGGAYSHIAAKALASVSGWSVCSTVGSVGNNPAANNKSGFNGFPVGARGWKIGVFTDCGKSSTWWSSTKHAYYSDLANTRSLEYYYSWICRYAMDKHNGVSVRCLKDVKTVQLLQIKIYANDSTVCSGSPTMLVAQACGGTKPIKYQWNTGSTNDTISVTPTSTTTYTVTVKDADGQTATDTVIVTVLQPTSSIDSVTINNGESYTFNGKTYSIPGTYSDTLTNVAGCDSIATLVLTIANSTTIWITSTITKFECSGESSTTFTAVTTNGGTNSVYQWKLNGLTVGTNDTVFTATDLSIGDSVWCEVTYGGSILKSNIITIKTLESSVTDIENTNYKTVDIGGQTWMAENLKATTYNDGVAIPNVTDNSAWANLTIGAYCNYDNLESNADKYGRLYNWYAVNTDKLCPSGWHIPSYIDWTTLQNYLIANGYNYDGSSTGDKIAKAMASTTDWKTSPISGAVGNNQSKNNNSEFNALPSGVRIFDLGGIFANIVKRAVFWSSTKYNSRSSYATAIAYNYDSLYIGRDSDNSGLSLTHIAANPNEYS